MSADENPKYYPFSEVRRLLPEHVVFAIRKRRLWFGTFAAALLILFVALQCEGSMERPNSLWEFFTGIPWLLFLIFVFPVGLIWWLIRILPSGTEVGNSVVLVLGWGIYFIHGLLLLRAERWKTAGILMAVLVLLLITNICGCYAIWEGR
ncbi:MAG: hypothetical protein GX174_00430 [Lentisphaerae bacterium]|jgi:hypothetical protein|nr:hypothetical protein [Lentisphaerota bacterium]